MTRDERLRPERLAKLTSSRQRLEQDIAGLKEDRERSIGNHGHLDSQILQLEIALEVYRREIDIMQKL